MAEENVDKEKKNKEKKKSHDPSKYVELNPDTNESLLNSVSENNFDAFLKLLPEEFEDFAEEIFESLSNGMDLDEVLSVAQRKKRGRTMRRHSKRNAKKRKISMRRKADSKKLQQRSRKRAKTIIKDKLAGGKKYSELSPSQKVQIDKKAVRFKGAINRIAKRQLPKVRKAEMERVKKMRGRKNEERSLNELFETFLNKMVEACDTDTKPKKRFHRLLDNDKKPVIDKRFKIYRKSDVEEFQKEALELKEMVESEYADIQNGYDNIEKGSTVSFTQHSMDMLDDETIERTGTVVDSTVSHLRVRCPDGKLYKVPHDNAYLISEAVLTLDEAFNIRFLDESAVLAKAIEAVHRHVLKGKDLMDIANEIVKMTGIDIGAHEIVKQYVKKYGDPKKRNIDQDKVSKLKSKYL